MILDFHEDPGAAKLYDVFDAVSGQCLNHLGIVYANDVHGFIRRHADPEYAVNGSRSLVEERRPILIRRRRA